MRKLLNTLYVSSQGSYLQKEGETVVVEREKQRVLQLPIHTIGGIVCFGNVLCSPFLLGFCAERDVSVSFLSEHGRFLASVRGPVSGNVLLRRRQYRMADDDESTRRIASQVISGKLANCRIVMNRTIRDHAAKVDALALKAASEAIDRIIDRIPRAKSSDEIRGFEGQAAAEYFKVLNHLIIEQKNDFIFTERNRRPPLDEVNALLSFMYTLLAHDVRSALETVGLDPAVGFLHRDRPGRPGLALDIMEEFRPVIADRLVLSLINRRQITKKGFSKAANGAVTMDDATRKTVLTEYQSRKQDTVYHPYIEETVPIGLLFFIQANLMAHHIRGDIDGYPPFFWR
ncbi:type I-C CRISPR-associated endonuclease Cas1c [Treponema primitia]|uniref:type I-C CRISPR-associated endonuclease Cas1c n=1 Tax=Treponema primitia TaxID=88058 RepID=UPI00025558B9|nr:type I-C CRISPR-associated endonuclease Cas1c [Treponema primitia]